MPTEKTEKKTRNSFITKAKTIGRGFPNSKSKGMFILLGLVCLLLTTLIFIKSRVEPSPAKPSLLPPTPTPEEKILNPSAYATDAAVLEAEKELEKIENELIETDLYESNLAPPVLDLKVKF